MDYTTLPEKLGRLVSLKKFADDSGIQRRTLQRVKAGGNHTIQTYSKIATALIVHKPKMKK